MATISLCSDTRNAEGWPRNNFLVFLPVPTWQLLRSCSEYLKYTMLTLGLVFTSDRLLTLVKGINTTITKFTKVFTLQSDCIMHCCVADVSV